MKTRNEKESEKRVYGEIRYYGVYINKGNDNYFFKAQVEINGKIKHIGVYSTTHDAAKAYNDYVVACKLPNQINEVV